MITASARILLTISEETMQGLRPSFERIAPIATSHFASAFSKTTGCITDVKILVPIFSYTSSSSPATDNTIETRFWTDSGTIC